MSAEHDIPLLLGELSGKLESLAEQVSKSDNRTYRQLCAVNKRLRSLDNHAQRIKTVEDDVSEIKPVIEDVKRYRWSATGFVAALTMVAGAVGGLIMQFFRSWT